MSKKKYIDADIVYAAQKDIRMATYWFAAAVLNITVTMGG